MTEPEDSSLATGRCLCGAVTLRFPIANALGAGHCHCTDCQRATGSGKATIVFLPEDAVERNGEVAGFSVRGTDGSLVTRSFCPTCGSQLLSQVAEQPGLLFVKAGCLDDSAWIKPVASYWTASARNWSPAETGLPGHEGNPEPIG